MQGCGRPGLSIVQIRLGLSWWKEGGWASRVWTRCWISEEIRAAAREGTKQEESGKEKQREIGGMEAEELFWTWGIFWHAPGWTQQQGRGSDWEFWRVAPGRLHLLHKGGEIWWLERGDNLLSDFCLSYGCDAKGRMALACKMPKLKQLLSHFRGNIVILDLYMLSVV